MARTPATTSIDGREHLTSSQVARYLGVRLETVYAYVSRGVLNRVRLPGSKESYFALTEVRALTGGPRRQRRRPGLTDTVQTSVTLIDHDQVYFRGRPVGELADTGDFEQVCALLWQSGPVRFAADPAEVDRVRAALPATVPGSNRVKVAIDPAEVEWVRAALPAAVAVLDRLKIAITLAGASDPGRHDLAPASVVQSATRAIGLAAATLPGATTGSVADLVTQHLGNPEARDLVGRVLVLLADHDIAMSTTAARVTASVRGDPYAVITAGLCAVDSPYHGSASVGAYRLLTSARADPRRVLGECLAGQTPPPGFGHVIYQHADPRAEYLRRHLPDIPLADELRARRGWFPNVDLMLAALALRYDLPETAGELLFALSRMAGWIAHALEEYDAKPLRFRLRGVYTGVRPGR
ncbi:citrate synthase [Kibdelosporangium lantanae]